MSPYFNDAEGRICAVSAPNGLGGITMTGYIYDADGTRVSKGAIQAWSCNPTTSQYATTSDYILGPGGEQFSEYTMNAGGTMAWQHTNVWAAGRLIATYAQDDTVKSGTTTDSGLLHFYFDDPLGTRRAQTDYAGHLEQNCSSLPYGDAESCAAMPTEHLFTGKERDTESGNDYFGARYYASSMGRFVSPDWSAKEEPVPYATMDDPQSLNLYSYVRNNPLTRVDADGHYDWDSAIVSLSTTAGGLAGGLIGGTVGAGTGTLVVPVFGTIAGADVGFGLGMAGGAALGRGIGKGIVNALNSSNSSDQAPAPAATPAPAAGSTSEGTYEFPDATSPGKTYVGQSGDVPRRLGEHEATGKKEAGTEAKTTPVSGGKTAREVVETKRIKELGGTTTKEGSQTSNKRLPVSDKRMEKINNGSSN
jgi:RHS repeat-associated protein